MEYRFLLTAGYTQPVIYVLVKTDTLSVCHESYWFHHLSENQWCCAETEAKGSELVYYSLEDKA